MTRKDYELIAAALDRARAVIVSDGYVHDDRGRLADQLHGLDEAARQLALALALGGTNPRFDRDKFLAAAQQGPEVAVALNSIALARNVGPGSTKG